MNSTEKLKEITQQNGHLMIGLDPVIEKIPQHLIGNNSPAGAFLAFNKAIIDETFDIASAYKPNFAFYEALGWEGIRVLEKTFEYIRSKDERIFTVLDFKRGDIDTTNNGSADFAFKHCQADAVTLAPFMGGQSLEPFWGTWKEKLFFVLACTSNKGADQFQNTMCFLDEKPYPKLYEYVIDEFMEHHNIHSNIAFVAGATYPEKLKNARTKVGDKTWLLIPGVGAQGAGVVPTVQAGMNSQGSGFLVNSSREIIYASKGENFAEAARAVAERTKSEIDKACMKVEI